jgi:type IV secretory pathway ATPase VirB11/archaellum biosynthesis ATPase
MPAFAEGNAWPISFIFVKPFGFGGETAEEAGLVAEGAQDGTHSEAVTFSSESIGALFDEIDADSLGVEPAYFPGTNSVAEGAREKFIFVGDINDCLKLKTI